MTGAGSASLDAQTEVERPSFIEDGSDDGVRNIDPYKKGASETLGAFVRSQLVHEFLS